MMLRPLKKNIKKCHTRTYSTHLTVSTLMQPYSQPPDSWTTYHLPPTDYKLPTVTCHLPTATCQLPPANLCSQNFFQPEKNFARIFCPPKYFFQPGNVFTQDFFLHDKQIILQKFFSAIMFFSTRFFFLTEFFFLREFF